MLTSGLRGQTVELVSEVKNVQSYILRVPAVPLNGVVKLPMSVHVWYVFAVLHNVRSKIQIHLFMLRSHT